MRTAAVFTVAIFFTLWVGRAFPQAQGPDIALGALSQRVKPGDAVSVRVTGGEDIIGTFARASDASLTVVAADVHAAAQEPEVPLGVRIRVTTPGVAATAPPRLHVGRLIGLDVSSLVLVDGQGHTATIARLDIMRVERSRGRPSRGRRAGLGLLIGAAAGAVLGVASCANCKGFCFPSGGVTLGLGLIGGGIGVVVGAALPAPERWEELRPWTSTSDRWGVQ